jgi:hypothetical protein
VIRSRLVASSLALSLVLAPACKPEQPAVSTTVGPAPVSSGPTTPDAKPADSTAHAEPPAVVVAPAQLAELDLLLDLLPVDATELVIVRDPKALVEGLAWFIAGERDALKRLEDAKLAELPPDPERERFLRDFEVIATAILGSVIQLDRGMLVFERAGETITLVASPDPTAIPALVTKIRGGTDTAAVFCKPAAGLAGWVACASKEPTIDGFVAGRQAADRRKQLLAELAGGDLDRANVVMRFTGGGGEQPSTVAIETAPGEIELHIGHPALAEVDKALAPGAAPALGLVPASGSFAWARLARAMLDDAGKQAPVPFGSAVASATGELLFGWIDGAGVVALAGVGDPSTVTGLLPLVGLAKDKIPKQLPDGSVLAVEVRDVDDGSGKPRPTVLAKLTPSAELAKSITAMGLAPEAVVFASGGYAAAVLGGGEKAIPTIAGYTGTRASEATSAALPAGLQRALAADTAEAILHISLDGLQSTAVRQSLVDLSKVQPTPGVDVGKVIGVVLDVLAPLSSLSMWITRDGGVHTVHLAVRSFDDYASEEGKAARAAMLAVGSGGDASTAYGELSTRFAGSARASSYDLRSGKGASVGQAASSAFLAGIIAAIAIPAFTKYRERAAAAAASK